MTGWLLQRIPPPRKFHSNIPMAAIFLQCDGGRRSATTWPRDDVDQIEDKGERRRRKEGDGGVADEPRQRGKDWPAVAEWDSASPQQKLLIYCCLFADYNPIRNTDGGLCTLPALKTFASSIDPTPHTRQSTWSRKSATIRRCQVTVNDALPFCYFRADSNSISLVNWN